MRHRRSLRGSLAQWRSRVIHIRCSRPHRSHLFQPTLVPWTTNRSGQLATYLWIDDRFCRMWSNGVSRLGGVGRLGTIGRY